MNQRFPRIRCGRSKAWTLIELMGVLSLLAILSAVLVPVMVRELDRIARALEVREMSVFASTVEQGIRRQRQIPDATGWAGFVAAELGRQVEEVQTNARGGRRLWIVDPRLRVGPASGAMLPFQQGPLGSVEPVSPRVVLVSSLGEPLPATVRDGVASSTARFDAIWSASPGSVPGGWSWSGKGEDLVIERLHFSSQFVPVVLTQSSEAPSGKFGLDDGETNVAPAGVFQTWYLRGSLLRLHATDGALQVSSVLREAVSLGFERGAWRGRLSFQTVGGHSTGVTVEESSERFVSAPENPAAVGPEGLVTPSQALLCVSNFIAVYRIWALDGFPRDAAQEASVQSAVDRMDSATAELVRSP